MPAASREQLIETDYTCLWKGEFTARYYSASADRLLNSAEKVVAEVPPRSVIHRADAYPVP